MTELGAIADRLEQIGHPGPSAAVRTLEYVMSLKLTPSLDDVLIHAIVRLRDDGQDDMRRALDVAISQLDRRQADRRHAVQVVNPDGVLEIHPAIREGVERWIADVAPKLDGLAITVRAGMWGIGSVELAMDRRALSRHWREVRAIPHHQIERGEDIAQHVFQYLDLMHLRIIDAFRSQAIGGR